MIGKELTLTDLSLYQNIIFNWYKEISTMVQHAEIFTKHDQDIIRSSFRVIDKLIDKLENPKGATFFAAIEESSVTLKVYAIGVANLRAKNGELLLLAADPKNLALERFRVTPRISGGGTAVVQKICEKTACLLVKPNASAVDFYQKLGFIRHPSQKNLLFKEGS